MKDVKKAIFLISFLALVLALVSYDLASNIVVWGNGTNGSDNTKLNKSGDTMTGALDMNGWSIYNVASFSIQNMYATYIYPNIVSILYLTKIQLGENYVSIYVRNEDSFAVTEINVSAGGIALSASNGITVAGPLNMTGHNITNCGNCNETNGLIFYEKLTANQTWVNITGLDINRDRGYEMDVQMTCRQATNLQLYVNNDGNNANYTRQFVYADGSGVISARGNDPGISACSAGKGSASNLHIFLDAFGKTHYLSETGLQTDTTLIFFNGDYNHDVSITNLTALNLKSSIPDSIGYGTQVWLYKK